MSEIKNLRNMGDMNRQLQTAKKRHMMILAVLIVLAAVCIILAAVMPVKTKKDDRDTTGSEPETSETQRTEDPEQDTGEETTENTDQNNTETTADISDTSDTSDTDISAETDTTAAAATETESTTQETTEAVIDLSTVDWSSVVFVGDSRTLCMAHGGTLEYGLVPDSQVFATWGGQLTDDSAILDAWQAGAAQTARAVFWFGINDVQLNAQRDDAGVFITNYSNIIDNYYKMVNPEVQTIYVVSVLNSTVREKDYYEGQDQNIAAYNEALKNYCAENGYVYLDATPLLTGDECFADGDNIHFSKEWYEEKFLPFIVKNVLY